MIKNFTLKPIKEEDYTNWESLLDKFGNIPFYQSINWSNYRKTLGWLNYKVGIFCNDNLIGGAIIEKFTFKKLGFSFLNIVDGPIFFDEILSYEEQWKMIRDFILNIKKQSNIPISHIQIEPRTTSIPPFLRSFKLSKKVSKPDQTSFIDLKRDEIDLLKSMSQKCRYNIRKSELNCLNLVINQDINSFYDLYTKTCLRNNIEIKPRFVFENLFTEYKNKIKIFNVYSENKLIASAIVMFDLNASIYLYGATDVSIRKMQSYFLHWNIIKHSKNLGYSLYDLYGISDYLASWKGITRFKKQFGGNIKKYIGSYNLVLEPMYYEKFQEMN